MRPRCVIFGAGGHARVLLDLILEAGAAEPWALLDPDRARWGEEVYGVRVVGGDECLPHLAADGVSHFVVGVGSVGRGSARKRLYEIGTACGLAPLTLIHPTAVRSSRATLGSGAQVLPAAVVNAAARLGENVLVNTAAVVEHDCTIGNHVHVATGARLAGGVRVGDAAHIGAGATVLQGRVIGAGAIVGAGATVVRDVAPGDVVVGVPARVLRAAGPSEEKP